MAIQQIHLFESRTNAFKEDEVLQENVILHATKGDPQGQVTLSASKNADFGQLHRRLVDFAQIVKPGDVEQFIHITINERDQQVVEQMSALPCTLKELGIEVSTGPVVDFRLKEYLRSTAELEAGGFDLVGFGTVPLIYPAHMNNGFVSWPLPNGRKANAICSVEAVQKWLYPKGHYALLRRFSAKEERRRVVAAVYDANDFPGEQVGFENHLNVFHCGRHGLTAELARGLAVYLNSTFFDTCFRQFNGNTQVNVKDLHNLRYPNVATLRALGQRVVGRIFPTQSEIDAWFEETLF